MKKIIKICLLFFIIPFYISSQESKLEIATNFLNLFLTEDYSNAYQMFDSTVKSKMNLEQFSSILDKIEESYGEFKNIIDTTIQTESSIYDFGLKFENASLNFRVVLNTENEISGFWITPYTKSSDYKIPNYANIAKFKEIEVKFGLNDWKLTGTLTIPNRIEKPPVVVLVHGSGPNDRDETIGPNKPFKDITYGLASNKIAVLRYDKRTKLYGHKINPANINIRNEVVEDAIEAIKFLKLRNDIDTNNIFLLGHSLGAMVGPLIASEVNLKGLILLAAPARKLEDLILDQFNYIFSLKENLSEEEKNIYETTKNKIDSLKKQTLPPDASIIGVPAGYFYDLHNYDQVKTARNLKTNILILQGTKDYQVTMKDFTIWEKELGNNKNVKLIKYENLNHLFILCEDKPTPEQLFFPGTVDQKVITDIQKWIEALIKN